MRALAMLAALALATAPILAAPGEARADGVERPRAPRVRPRPAAPAPAPAELAGAPVEDGPETVTLPASFFAVAGGGVGADIGANAGFVSSTTIIVRGGRASAFAFASTRAAARAGGGHGCGGCR
jgi:hypothetical protein